MDVDLVLDFLEERLGKVDRDENDLRVRSVLSLREQIRGYEDWVGRLVCNDLGLACGCDCEAGLGEGRGDRRPSEWVRDYEGDVKLTKTSDGPAGMSIDTSASVSFCTSIFAAVTHWLPGPKILSTLGQVSVP